MHLILLVLVSTLGPFQFGYHLSELNALYNSIACPSSNLAQTASCMAISTPVWAAIQSIYTIGGLCGTLLLGTKRFARFGRLPTMQVVALVLLLGALAEAFALNPPLLAAARFLSGLGAGAATVVCPIYIAEIVPLHRRGLFGSFTQVMVNFGIFAGLLVGTLFGKNSQWRLALGSGACPALLMLLGLAFAPESPKWLEKQRRRSVAVDSVRQPLLTKPAAVQTENVESQSAQGTRRMPVLMRDVSFLGVMRSSKYRMTTIAIVGTMMAQQLTGINSASLYSVSILSAVVPANAAIISISVAAINVLATAAFSVLPDAIGRKPCLLISTAGMGLSSVLLAIGLSTGITALLVPGLMAFVCSFSAGLGPIPFLLASELAGEDAVGAVSSWALAGNWTSSFLVAQFFPMLNAALPRGYVFWIFAGIALVFEVFIALVLPESKELNSIDNA